MECIIDVGTSWNALRTIPLRDRFGLPVLFIEPDVDALNRVPANPADICLNAAITSYDGIADFFFYQDGTHSLLETNLEEIHKYIDGQTGRSATRDDWTSSRSVSIPCFRLETVLSHFSVESVAFLKIDAQGHDLEVLRSLGDRIRSVRIFEVEVQVTDFELYRGQSRKSEVLEFAEANDFDLVASYPQTFGQELVLIFVNRNHESAEAERLTRLILDKLKDSQIANAEVARGGIWGIGKSFFSRIHGLLERSRDLIRKRRS